PDSSTRSSNECVKPNSSCSAPSVASTSVSRSGQRASRALSCASASTRVSREFGSLTSLAVEVVHRGADELELEHAVDVGAAQLEDTLHAGELGDGVDVATQPLEDRTAPFGALVLEHHAVAVEGGRIDDDDARARVLREVAHRLREELVRQDHAL